MSDAGEPGEVAEEIMAGFRRTSAGVSARFTPAQAGIVRSLVGQVAELIGGPGASTAPDPDEVATAAEPFGTDELAALLDDGPGAQPPEDPVLARLFPDGYKEDPEAAGEFRRYTEHGLREGKLAGARTVLAEMPGKGGRVRLSEADAQVWLRVLNDVRLALGVRLGISEDYEHDLANVDTADPRAAYLQVYDWLTFLQETLVRALW